MVRGRRLVPRRAARAYPASVRRHLGRHRREPDGPHGRSCGLDLSADVTATPDDWGVAKPDPRFFRKMIEASRSAVIRPCSM